MPKTLLFFISLLLFGIARAQTSIYTNHSNNNGNASITFNVHNSNAYDILVTDVHCHLGTTTTNNCQLLVNTTPVNDGSAPWNGGVIGDGQNGWQLKGSATVSSSNTSNGVVTAISGMEIIIPAGATYGFGFSATTLQYQTLTNGAGNNNFTQDGVSLITGDNVSWGGTAYPSTPANYPRGFIGGISFVPALPCMPSFTSATVTSSKNCTSDPVTLSVPFAGTAATFEWQSSANGTDFSPVSGATSRTYETSVASDTYFRCVITCEGGTHTTDSYLLKSGRTGQITSTICHGATLDVNGTTYNSSGTYTQTLTASNGCDSILTIDLTVADAIESTLDTAICAGSSLEIGGNSYTTEGTYTEVFAAANGCDSTVTIHLSIKEPTTSTITHTECATYTLNGQTYTQSGSYTQVLVNSAGCDSTITLNLTIKQPTATTLTESTCAPFTLNGTTYASSGTYTQTLTNSEGCDSIITLHLTVNEPSSTTLTEAACSSYSLNGFTYNTSGTYTQNLTSNAGCDSVITLHLTIDTVSTSITENGSTLTAIDDSPGTSYQWIDCSTGNEISGATAQSWQATGNGSYKVVVNKGACASSSECYAVTKFSGDAHLYPNPGKGAFTILLTKVHPKVEVELYNTNGKIMLRKLYWNTNRVSVNHSMPAGLYQVRIVAGDVIQFKKVMVVN